MKYRTHVSVDDLMDMLRWATQAQQDHVALIKATGPCTVAPHQEAMEACPACRHHVALYRSIGQLRLIPIRLLEARGSLPEGSTEEERVRQSCEASG